MVPFIQDLVECILHPQDKWGLLILVATATAEMADLGTASGIDQNTGVNGPGLPRPIKPLPNDSPKADKKSAIPRPYQKRVDPDNKYSLPSLSTFTSPNPPKNIFAFSPQTHMIVKPPREFNIVEDSRPRGKRIGLAGVPIPKPKEVKTVKEPNNRVEKPPKRPKEQLDDRHLTIAQRKKIKLCKDIEKAYKKAEQEQAKMSAIKTEPDMEGFGKKETKKVVGDKPELKNLSAKKSRSTSYAHNKYSNDPFNQPPQERKPPSNNFEKFIRKCTKDFPPDLLEQLTHEQIVSGAFGILLKETMKRIRKGTRAKRLEKLNELKFNKHLEEVKELTEALFKYASLLEGITHPEQNATSGEGLDNAVLDDEIFKEEESEEELLPAYVHLQELETIISGDPSVAEYIDLELPLEFIEPFRFELLHLQMTEVAKKNLCRVKSTNNPRHWHFEPLVKCKDPKDEARKKKEMNLIEVQQNLNIPFQHINPFYYEALLDMLVKSVECSTSMSAEDKEEKLVEARLIQRDPSLLGFKFVHRLKQDDSVTSITDSKDRQFALRVQAATVQAGWKDLTSLLSCEVDEAFYPEDGNDKIKEQETDGARGMHQIRQVGVGREVGNQIGYSRPFTSKIKLWTRLFEKPGWVYTRERVAESFKTFFPDLYQYYGELAKSISEPPTYLDFVYGAFASICVNTGGKVATNKHRDFLNLGPGLCGVVPFGKFDSKRSGWLVLWDPKICVEAAAGDIVLFPSGVVTHSNTSIHHDDERNSLAFWCGSSLFLWNECGRKPFTQLSPEEQKEKMKDSQDKWKQAWNRFPIMKDSKEHLKMCLKDLQK